MFNGYGVVKLDGDHLDLSYHDLDPWPAMGPDREISSLNFEIGNPLTGPFVQLAALKPGTDKLDWEHSFDPPHYHGSDQFRIVSGGEWIVAGKPQTAGCYSFQEAGRVYREHPGSVGAWAMIFLADRRGSKPTIIHESDRLTLVQLDNEHYIPVREGEAYPHPAGAGGIAAVTTSVGPCQQGYLFGRFAELQSKAVTGLLGDERTGPAVHLLKIGANELVMPASVYASELMLSVTSGSCMIDDREYIAGDMRIQNANAPMGAIMSGPEGLEGALIVTDRSVPPVVAESDTALAPAWIFEPERLRRELSPRPGQR